MTSTYYAMITFQPDGSLMLESPDYFFRVREIGRLRQTRRDVPRTELVWRSLTPPSKIGKGSGEPRIIDLCHKPNIGSPNQISERNSYLIVYYVISTLSALCVIALLAGMVAEEKRAALADKKAMHKLGYNDMKACQLQCCIHV